MEIKQYQLIISGHVQGVSYRISAREQARQLELSGWIRNLADGRVEMLIEGETGHLDLMTEWAGKGPRFASVTHVDITEKTASGEFTEFNIR